jgi:hypothetical protein
MENGKRWRQYSQKAYPVPFENHKSQHDLTWNDCSLKEDSMSLLWGTNWTSECKGIWLGAFSNEGKELVGYEFWTNCGLYILDNLRIIHSGLVVIYSGQLVGYTIWVTCGLYILETLWVIHSGQIVGYTFWTTCWLYIPDLWLYILGNLRVIQSG